MLNAKLSKREMGKLVRHKFLEQITKEWGDYKSLNGYLYEFGNKNKIVLMYSKLNTNSAWWYGVSQDYWEKWDDNTYMALLMREEMKCAYRLLNPRDSIKLLNQINPDNDGKKHINISFPSLGPIYIQKWNDFPFEQKIVNLGNIETEDSDDKLNQVPFERVEIDYVEYAIERFKNMLPEERKAFLEDLRNM